MNTELTFRHKQDIIYMRKGGFKPHITKWFKDVELIGYIFEEYCPTISISNWDEVKDKLPSKLQPINVDGVMNKFHPNYDAFKEYIK